MTTTAHPSFHPVKTSFDSASTSPSPHDDVESPSLSNGNALARFEFEPGRGNDGTKILMVEWEEDSITNNISDDWEISWHGKRTVLPARDHASPGAGMEDTPVNRLYFLLGPGVSIPTAVKLRKGPSVNWRTNPLPAIFQPELGATARQAGKKGVLHTIWAKKRLQVLNDEIARESADNEEGVGLEIAVAEKEWIEANFGVLAKPAGISLVTAQTQLGGGGLGSPTSPRSPGGGRLMDKLKGLKLGTSEKELTASSLSTVDDQNAQPAAAYNPLSPEGSDVAVGSFSSFATLKGMPPAASTLAAKAPQAPSAATQPPPSRRIVAQSPPEAFVAQQRQQVGMGSLNAFASSGNDVGIDEEDGNEDDLFALPMSPRSPDMAKGPFSFTRDDTEKYLKG
ncbi:unnamed protein product [Zymoseptoria tritici ST99CH_3D7]|uniref:Uncharacterized protein n=1 Tax=Zymoseptoria tritici (strain ST99CH_3D7) TaxID=1276538 RepID=A0A1X7RXU7_ZYMT9|nr:unnamed protein product [Zymoseptoria tritici ST99CH_3D7]